MNQGNTNRKLEFPFSPYRPAAESIRSDPNLTEPEQRLLLECLRIRQQDREFRGQMRHQVGLDREAANDVERDFIAGCNSWHPRAIWFRFMSGDMFETSRDFQARDLANRKFNELAVRRGERLREHNQAVQSEEKRMRGLLAGSSPYAKRAFNTLALSTTTGAHFPPEEIRAAAHLPNPLERILD